MMLRATGRSPFCGFWVGLVLGVCLACNAGAMRLFVAMPAGITVPVEVADAGTIGDLKAAIQASAGVAVNDQRLFLGNDELENLHDLSDYGIQEGATLRLVLGLRIQLAAATFPGGGGLAASKNYSQTDSLNPVSTGVSSSGSYSIEGGFFDSVAIPVTAGSPPSVRVTNDFILIPVSDLLAASENPEGESLSLFFVDSTSWRGGSLVVSNGFVIYTPPAFTNFDTFTFTVRDADGNLSSAVVSILRIPASPRVDPIPDQWAQVLIPTVVTNHASDASLPLTWSLGDGFPANTRINPETGTLVFTPSRRQAHTTNIVSVIVSNSARPPARTTNAFTVVVGDYAEMVLGRAMVLSGSTNSIPMTLSASAPLTNLQVTIRVSEAEALPLELLDVPSTVNNTVLERVSPDVWRVEFSSIEGQFLPTNQPLARVNFQGTALHSAFAPIDLLEMNSIEPGASVLERNLFQGGRLVVIATEPLLEVLPRTDTQMAVFVYGIPGKDYEILSSPVLPAPGWQLIGTVVVPVDGLAPGWDVPNSEPILFFQAREAH